MALDGAEGQAGDGSDLRDIHLFEEAQEKDGALTVRELRDGLPDERDLLLGDELFFGRTVAGWHAGGDVGDVDGAGGGVLPEAEAAGAGMVAGQIEGDADEPGAEGAVLAEGGACGPGAEKGFLGEGLGGIAVAESGQKEAEDARLVESNDVVEIVKGRGAGIRAEREADCRETLDVFNRHAVPRLHRFLADFPAILGQLKGQTKAYARKSTPRSDYLRAQAEGRKLLTWLGYPAGAMQFVKAIYPGTFDPLTNGHLDLIARGSRFVDELVVAILRNADKGVPLFTVEERREMIAEAIREEGFENVSVTTFDGLLVDFAKQQGARAVLRGIRAISDYEYEFQMAMMNRKLDPDLETLFMMPAEKYTYVSSRLIKGVFKLGGDVAELVPPLVMQRLKAKGTGKI